MKFLDMYILKSRANNAGVDFVPGEREKNNQTHRERNLKKYKCTKLVGTREHFFRSLLFLFVAEQ